MREIAVRYVEGTNPYDQQMVIEKMVAEGYEVAGWGSVVGDKQPAMGGPSLAVTVGFMLYFGRDKTAALAAELMDDAKKDVAAAMPPLSRRERRALERTGAV